MAEPFDLFYLPFRPALDANGIVVAGATLTFYISGTSTLQAVFADAGLTTPLANPLSANAAGVWPSIYIDSSKTYRIVLRDSDGAPLNEVDPYVPGSVGGANGPPGSADNTYTILLAFKASDIGRKTASLVGVPGVPDGRFNWTLGDFTGRADDVNIIKGDSTALTVGAWVRSIETAAKPAGQTAANFTTAGKVTGDIVITPGAYNLGGTLALADSLSIYGTGGKRGQVSLEGAGDAPVIRVSSTGGEYDRNGPSFSDFTTYNRQGIEIGDRTSAIGEGGGQSVYHYWSLEKLNIIDRSLADSPSDLGAVGVSITKAFNGKLELCEVLGFKIGVLLNGADINTVSCNRISGWSQFGVLETSASSFGSQTTFIGNDVLGSSKIANGASYKSTGRHNSLISNYFEPQGAMAAGAGFVDFSFGGVPAYGGNSPGQILSIFAIGNRIDSQGLASFVYRMCVTDARSVTLLGRQTSDASTTPSYFCDAPGNRLDVIPMHSGLRARQYLISEVTMGVEWHGHQDEPGVTFGNGGFSVNARNKAAFPYTTIVTGRPAFVAHQGDTLVIPATNAGQPIPIFPGGYGGNRFFDSGSTYELVVVARSSSASGDTLSVQQCGVTDAGAGFGTSYETLPLTNQFRELRFLVPGRPSNYQAVGFHVQSATSVGDIYFHTYWREVRGSFDRPLRIGARLYWTDATGALRSSATAPATDTSGQVVGPYTPGA